MKYVEEQIQKGCVTWFNLQYPELFGCLCSNLNNSKDAKTGARNKALGVVAGRSDLVFYFKSKAYHIEVKQPKSYQNKAQKEWQKIIELQGFSYYLVYSFEDFKEIIKNILKENN